jgi:hypothetical protein
MPPDYAPPPDAGSRPGVPAGIPEPPKREINWTAVGSLAAVAAALIAFLAWALPGGGPNPDPAPTPPSPTVSVTTPLPTESTTAPATTSPPSPAPPITQSSGPPAGCQLADAAITTFNKLNGPTNRMAAASEAGQQIGVALQASERAGDSSAVTADLNALEQDFLHLDDYALVNDGTDYNNVLAQTNKDIQTLNGDCGAG